ncbi:hypothetical protein [Paraliomyxa miuraensis]|uniref:hypothetical protein n=1 Tax=Paraliomyxa miuraensis TaxID=376150 RepID=UPI002255D852|nr:hypothetical protein [Paraliomyxa miuraensis]MCX4246184.1 hypothetical protein [Paraliomyxa miuraensis]
MTSTLGFILRRSLPLCAAGLLAGLCASACDLPDKNLGDDPPGTTGGTCEPGDEMMLDCNTCSCHDGEWSCTAIACADTDSSADSGNTCDPADEPVDECNSCSCVDGQWVCTTIGCDPTDTDTDTDPGSCDPGSNPTNGCNTCECQAGEWICTDEACPEEPAVGLCDGTEPTDPVSIIDASIVGDTLVLAVEYGGGCVEHMFGSCWDGSFAESDPVQAWLQVNHEDNDDPCDGVVMEERNFDLSPMRQAWIDAYMQANGTITLHVADWGSIDYVF